MKNLTIRTKSRPWLISDIITVLSGEGINIMSIDLDASETRATITVAVKEYMQAKEALGKNGFSDIIVGRGDPNPAACGTTSARGEVMGKRVVAWARS